MKKELVVIILAAGSGKRFWPFVQDKNLFPFMGKSYFDFTVAETLPDEMSKAIIVVNETNRKKFESMKFSFHPTFVVQKDGNGMADAIIAVKDHIRNCRILVVIADDVSDVDVFRSVLHEANKSYTGVLPVFQTPTYFPGGYIKFQGQRPIGIVEKPKEGKEPSSFVYFGGQYFENADELIKAIDEVQTTDDDVYERAISKLMKSNEFICVPQTDPFVTLKYPWHVLDVTNHLLHHRFSPGRGKRIEIQNNVVIDGAVYIGNNVRIFENTKIVGPVYIGDNTIIGNNNIIRDSYIGKNCVTGFNTDIARSYIGDHCWFHSNYIGDSVLEGNISMGSGTVLANLRLDEGEIWSTVRGEKINTHRTKLGAMIGQNVRIGVNVSIMPGVKIGSDSMIGAGITVDKDIPEQSFCMIKNVYEIKKNTKAVRSASNRTDFLSKL